MAKRVKRVKETKRVSRSTGGTFLLFFILIFFAVLMALPMVLAISNSLKPLSELWEFPPKLFPRSPTLKNFADMFNIMSDSLIPFARYIFNTLFITGVGTAGNIILSSMCAFPLAKKKFPGKDAIFSIIVTSLMFNGTVTAIPNYIVMSTLGWIDTYWSIIVPAFASTLGLYLMKQFMEQSVPSTLLEAARIDGASQWLIFWKIVMPCVKPAWLTQLLLSVQALWNLGSSTFIFSDEKKTLAYALGQIVSGGVARAGVGAAVSVFMMVVPISIFAFSQSNIVDTMSTSGMKD
ncbi:MAG: carbohydrate ABC transporter permease [Clostridia bacterium]|nr:carbohydrate ABC transporter permease [Clostridia bacterium]